MRKWRSIERACLSVGKRDIGESICAAYVRPTALGRSQRVKVCGARAPSHVGRNGVLFPPALHLRLTAAFGNRETHCPTQSKTTSLAATSRPIHPQRPRSTETRSIKHPRYTSASAFSRSSTSQPAHSSAAAMAAVAESSRSSTSSSSGSSASRQWSVFSAFRSRDRSHHPANRPSP
jgi:hypothetical protein